MNIDMLFLTEVVPISFTVNVVNSQEACRMAAEEGKSKAEVKELAVCGSDQFMITEPLEWNC